MFKYAAAPNIMAPNNRYPVPANTLKSLKKVIRQAPVEELLAGAFYVTGSTKRVDAYIKNCKVLGIQAVSDLKTAVIEGDIRTAKGSQGLKFFPLTMQKLFIHLTNNENEGQ